MLERASRISDVLQLGVVAYGAILAGVVVLLARGREELATGMTLIAGGLALAGVHRYVWKRSGALRESSNGGPTPGEEE